MQFRVKIEGFLLHQRQAQRLNPEVKDDGRSSDLEPLKHVMAALRRLEDIKH